MKRPVLRNVFILSEIDSLGLLCLTGVRSCKDALDDGFESGVYKIYPGDELTEMEVYCDFDHISGEAWTVRTIIVYFLWNTAAPLI